MLAAKVKLLEAHDKTKGNAIPEGLSDLYS
jgi:hypothetical protein